VRCFVATFLAPESARRLRSAARAGAGGLLRRPDARQVPLENYHVTLKFLGEVGEDALPEALEAVASLAAHGVVARVTGLIGLPRAGAARLLAAEMAPQPDLHAWWTALQARLGAEERPFRPHVTVLRLRRSRAFAPAALPEPVTVELAHPRLYRSDEGADGVRYRPVSLG